MKFIDFFAGIGGFRRGMELAGHECVGFCEFDKFATASYTSMHLLTEGGNRPQLSRHLRCRKTSRISRKPFKPVFQSYVPYRTTQRRR